MERREKERIFSRAFKRGEPGETLGLSGHSHDELFTRTISRKAIDRAEYFQRKVHTHLLDLGFLVEDISQEVDESGYFSKFDLYAIRKSSKLLIDIKERSNPYVWFFPDWYTRMQLKYSCRQGFKLMVLTVPVFTDSTYTDSEIIFRVIDLASILSTPLVKDYYYSKYTTGHKVGLVDTYNLDTVLPLV